MILPIYTFGADVLRQATPQLKENSEALQSLIDSMFETMHNAKGVGLAAPQVGRQERVFVVDLTASLEDEEGFDVAKLPGPLVFINPTIQPLDGHEAEYEEGCLSIPEIRENVVRPDAVEIEYLDRSLAPERLHASGLLARVIQHELDHLDGKIFLDHLSKIKRNIVEKKIERVRESIYK